MFEAAKTSIRLWVHREKERALHKQVIEQESVRVAANISNQTDVLVVETLSNELAALCNGAKNKDNITNDALDYAGMYVKSRLPEVFSTTSYYSALPSQEKNLRRQLGSVLSPEDVNTFMDTLNEKLTEHISNYKNSIKTAGYSFFPA